MKKIAFYGVLLVALIASCTSPKKEASQVGIYKLEKLTVNDGKKDTTYTGEKQIKIYTDSYFFYANMVNDSTVGFGIGTYTAANNKIVEHNVYNASSLDTASDFNLEITPTDKGYIQTIPDMQAQGTKFKLTEEYSTITPDSASALDGAWKLSKYYSVKGKDTTKQSVVQFKLFQGKHFLWAHRYPTDSTATKFTNGMGYGKFNLNNDILEEEGEISNYPVLIGKKFTIKVSFSGPDEYTQVMIDSAGTTKSYETYKRLK
jgi:hypothetical protein